MKDIAWTIMSYHWRKRHIIWLFLVLILVLFVWSFFGDLSLSEKSYVMMQRNTNSIEIIGLLFSLYFAASTYGHYQERKIRSILTTKRTSALSCIGGVIAWLSIIMIIYSIIGALIVLQINNTGIVTAFYQSIQRSMIFIVIISLAVLFSLYASAYIAIIATLSIYIVSYSLNFLLFTTDTIGDGFLHNILSIIALFLPRFDTLWSTSQWSWIWWRAFLAHVLYALVCASLAIVSFSLKHSWKSSQVSIHDSRKKD